MKRYLLFVGFYNNPSGGWNDLQGDFDDLKFAVSHVDTLEALFEEKDALPFEWAHVVDLEFRDIVASKENDGGGWAYINIKSEIAE